MQTFRKKSLSVFLFVAVAFVFSPRVFCGDLIKAPGDMVKYKLSNIRIEKGILGNVFAIDYKRVREGSGTARLAARSDQGDIEIQGFGAGFDSSGTVRVRDSFASLRTMLNRNGVGDGIEFYFVVSELPYGFGGDTYLVSNSIRHGEMRTKLSARKPTKKELAVAEARRIARMPPQTVPNGCQRATHDSKLVPGMPVKYGVAGKWRDAEVVSVEKSLIARLLEPGKNKLVSVPIAEWIAISEETLKQVHENPGQFVSDVRVLTGGNLVLDDDMTRLDKLSQKPASLPKGTPLAIEKSFKWVAAYLMSADSRQARVMISERDRPRVEFVQFDKIVIRKQTMNDLKDEDMRMAFADNLATFESRAVKLPGEGGALETVAILDSSAQADPFGNTIDKPTPELPIRAWKDSSGRFEVKGRLVSQTDDQIVILREDEKSIKVPTGSLSKADLQYLKDLKSTPDDNPFNNVVDASMPERSATDSSGRSAVNVDFSRPLQVVRQIGDLGWGAASVAISPDNRLLLIGRKGACASLFDLKTGAKLVDSGRMDHMGNVTACGFTPDGSQLIIGGSRGVVDVYNINSKGQMKLVQQFAPHQKSIISLCFSSDSQFALSGSEDKEARYWNVKTGQQIASLGKFSGKVKATRITPDGKLALATDGAVLKVYDIAQAKIVKEAKVGRSHASGQSAAISPNGLLLAVGDGYKFHLWNLVTFTELPIVEGKEIGWSAAFCPDNRHFITGGNGMVNVWDAKTQIRVTSHPVGSSYYVQAMTTSDDGSLIACPSAFKDVKVLKVATQ